jgi:hypothetical protein
MNSSPVSSRSRAENSADLLRVLVAVGLLALLASFDATEDAAAAAPDPANAGISADHSR